MGTHKETIERKTEPSTILKGMAMGIAEIIPGVSGGTIAFITGIYERLIAVIKNIGPGLITDWKSGGFKSVFNKLDIGFITFLFGGMVMGVVVGVFGVTYLLDNYPEPLWGFFFGLIIASAIYVGRQIDLSLIHI